MNNFISFLIGSAVDKLLEIIDVEGGNDFRIGQIGGNAPRNSDLQSYD